MPNLAALSLDCLTPDSVQAVCGMHLLRTLRLGANALLELLRSAEAQRLQLPAALTRVCVLHGGISTSGLLPDNTVKRLLGLLRAPSSCHIVLNDNIYLGQEDLLLAVRHAGGVGVELRTLDPRTGAITTREARGMVPVGSEVHLRALALAVRTDPRYRPHGLHILSSVPVWQARPWLPSIGMSEVCVHKDDGGPATLRHMLFDDAGRLLPGLRRVLLSVRCASCGTTEAVDELVEAGCEVRLLVADCGGMQKVRRVLQYTLNPDAVGVGWRSDVWSWEGA